MPEHYKMDVPGLSLLHPGILASLPIEHDIGVLGVHMLRLFLS